MNSKNQYYKESNSLLYFYPANPLVIIPATNFTGINLKGIEIIHKIIRKNEL